MKTQGAEVGKLSIRCGRKQRWRTSTGGRGKLVTSGQAKRFRWLPQLNRAAVQVDGVQSAAAHARDVAWASSLQTRMRRLE